MLAQGTHPPPIGHTLRKSQSAASSRNASRNNSPAPTPTREKSFLFDPAAYPLH
jgi:hypothetical protein